MSTGSTSFIKKGIYIIFSLFAFVHCKHLLLKIMKQLKNILVFLSVISLGHYCKSENCDKNGVLVYEDIACSPVTTKENSCPSKYDCDFSRPKSGCLFKGRSYTPREDISSDITYSACSVGCFCEDLNSIRCAVLDCPEHFGHSIKPGCYHGYELSKCCSTGQICNSTQTKQCKVDGDTYEIGQKFYPKGTCLSCVCHEDFTGDYDEKTCIRLNCNSQIHYGSEISQNCAPAYFKYQQNGVYCCPDDFVCPEDSDTIDVVNPDADKSSDLECSYGEKKLKLGEGLKRKVNKYGKDRDLQCECSIPPLLTCKEV